MYVCFCDPGMFFSCCERKKQYFADGNAEFSKQTDEQNKDGGDAFSWPGLKVWRSMGPKSCFDSSKR